MSGGVHMYYEDFAEEIRAGVEKLAQKEFPDCIVAIRNVVKNNSVRRKAISVVRKDEKATPTIYIKDYYEEFKGGREKSDICEEIFDLYKKGIDRFNKEIDIEDFLEYDRIKDRIFFKLVNRNLNETMLNELPNKEFLDLAVVYYVSVSNQDECNATALIHNYHVDHWGITASELHDVAFGNTIRKNKATILRMEDVVKELIVEQYLRDNNIIEEDNAYGGKTYEEIEDMVQEELEKVKESDPMEMFVLTNEKKVNGASCIMYPNVLKDFANEKESDFYVIPSSVHEVILVPMKAKSKERLVEILNDVNKNELDPMEVLSDKVYKYDRKKDEITL